MFRTTTKIRSPFGGSDDLELNRLFDLIGTSGPVIKSPISRVENEILEIIVPVVGHDPKNVTVETTEDRISIDAKSNVDEKSLKKQIVEDIQISYRLSDEWNGLSTKAKIENGLLTITVERKEQRKPKKVTVSF